MSIKLLKTSRQEEAKQQQQQRQQDKKQQQQVLKNGDAQVVVAGAAAETDAVLPDASESPSTTTKTIKTTTTTTTIKTTSSSSSPAESSNSDHYEAPLVWKNIFLFVVLHSCIPAALVLLADPHRRPQWLTLGWAVLGMYVSGLGVTGGAHRLWSHKAYKARLPVQVLLMLLQTMAGQNSIYTWCRDHRVHHKFSETHADPHNIKRGFFFAHMGWLCCRKHPDVLAKGKLIDMTDLEANKVVMFQHRNFWWLAIVFTVMLPMMVPVWLWHEHAWTSFIFSFMIRYLCTLHGTWLVNSAAHYFGTRPYDQGIEARESPWVILYGLGEGFHNYHHTFPYDYSTSEFGKYFNITTAFIDLCAALGLVYDRRKMDKETIAKRRKRTGGSSDVGHYDEEEDTHASRIGLVRRRRRKISCVSAAAAAMDHQQQDHDHLMKGSMMAHGGVADGGSGGQLVSSSSPLNMDIIHELPYISGLTSMKYTM